MIPHLVIAALLQEAAPAKPPPTGLGLNWMPLLLIFAIFWIVMIAPERKNRRRREEMLRGLKKGDRVLTASGMFGEVREVKEQQVTVQIADGVRVHFALGSIQDIVDAQGASLSQPPAKGKAAPAADASSS